jgi:hypothetical protein
MTKFMDRLDLQIRLKLTVRNLLAIVIYNFGKVTLNNKLEEWYKLSWEEFLEEIKFAGILIENESDKIYLKEKFEEQKQRIAYIENELNRHDKIVANNKIKIQDSKFKTQNFKPDYSPSRTSPARLHS